jgi:hypothetical protein
MSAGRRVDTKRSFVDLEQAVHVHSVPRSGSESHRDVADGAELNLRGQLDGLLNPVIERAAQSPSRWIR